MGVDTGVKQIAQRLIAVTKPHRFHDAGAIGAYPACVSIMFCMGLALSGE